MPSPVTLTRWRRGSTTRAELDALAALASGVVRVAAFPLRRDAPPARRDGPARRRLPRRDRTFVVLPVTTRSPGGERVPAVRAMIKALEATLADEGQRRAPSAATMRLSRTPSSR